MSCNGFQAVFFDLDGTLADTAPDLALALNLLLQEEGREALPLARVRPHVANGTRAMLALGLGITPEDPAYHALAARFLDHYAGHLSVGTQLFPGLPQVLDTLDSRCIRWGVVTNKTARFTLPLMQDLGLDQRCAAMVCGDSTPTPKPHPAPLLLACEQTNVMASRCLYVGDDERDIRAGRAAGMHTAAALWGYPGDRQVTQTWEADHYLSTPQDLLALISSQKVSDS